VSLPISVPNHGEADERRALETDLRRAISIGEFELFYQPVINLERLSNVVITPHIAARSEEAWDRRFRQIANNLDALSSGTPLRNIVRVVPSLSQTLFEAAALAC